MKFQIFEVVNQRIINYDEIDYIKIIKNVKCDCYSFQDVHNSVEGCEVEIKKHLKDLKYKDLIILPIICVNWDDEISENPRI